VGSTICWLQITLGDKAESCKLYIPPSPDDFLGACLHHRPVCMGSPPPGSHTLRGPSHIKGQQSITFAHTLVVPRDHAA
jgi:hypothetical protein